MEKVILRMITASQSMVGRISLFFSTHLKATDSRLIMCGSLPYYRHFSMQIEYKCPT